MKRTIRACIALLLLASVLAVTPLSAYAGNTLTVSCVSASPADTTPIPFVKAEASSYLVDLGTPFTADLAIDRDDTRPWIEGVTGYGVGEYLLLSFDADKTIDMLCIRPGFAGVYEGNSRPKTVELAFSDGSAALCEIPDRNQSCFFQFSAPVTTSYVRLTIVDVYAGQQCADTCIAEVSAYNTGRAPSGAAGTQYRLHAEREGSTYTEYVYNGGDTAPFSAFTYYDGKLERVTGYRYDTQGRLCERTETYMNTGLVLCFHYDSRGTQIECDDTGGVGSPANYSGGSTASETRDAAGRTTVFSVSSADGGQSAALYYEYDSLGRIIAFTGKSMHVLYQYQPDGSFVRIASYDFRSDTVVELVDADGHTTSKSWIENGTPLSTVSYLYDSRGNVSETRRDDGWVQTCEYEYDAYGNMTAKRETPGGGTARRTEYSYEPVM